MANVKPNNRVIAYSHPIWLLNPAVTPSPAPFTVSSTSTVTWISAAVIEPNPVYGGFAGRLPTGGGAGEGESAQGNFRNSEGGGEGETFGDVQGGFLASMPNLVDQGLGGFDRVTNARERRSANNRFGFGTNSKYLITAPAGVRIVSNETNVDIIQCFPTGSITSGSVFTVGLDSAGIPSLDLILNDLNADALVSLGFETTKMPFLKLFPYSDANAAGIVLSFDSAGLPYIQLLYNGPGEDGFVDTYILSVAQAGSLITTNMLNIRPGNPAGAPVGTDWGVLIQPKWSTSVGDPYEHPGGPDSILHVGGAITLDEMFPDLDQVTPSGAKGIVYLLSTGLYVRFDDGTIRSLATKDSAFPSLRIRNVSSVYTVVSSDDVLRCDSSLGAYAVNLPSADTFPEKPLRIIKRDASANTVTVTANGAQTINGAATFPLAAQYDKVTIIAVNATSWEIF